MLCCIAGLVMPPVDSLLFETAEKAFSHSIVETITNTAHATHKAMYFQKPPVFFTGILGGFNRLSQHF